MQMSEDINTENQKEFEVSLGNKIKLVDFKLRKSERLIIRKLIGNRVRKIEDLFDDFQEIKLRLKKLHESQDEDSDNSRYLINAHIMIGNKDFKAESEGFNLFMTLSELFDKIDAILKREFQKN